MKQTLFIILFLFSAFVVSQSSNSAIALFENYEKKGEYFNQKRELDSVKLYLSKIDVLTPKLKDSSYNYRADLIRGSALTLSSKSDEAMKILFKATEFFKLQNDFKNYYTGRFKIGVCYYYLNRKDDAKQAMLEVLDNKNYIGEDLATSALANIGAINIEKGMYSNNTALLQDAVQRFNTAIDINKRKKNHSKLASNYSLLAEAHNQLKNKQKAVQLLDSAIYYAKKEKDLSQEGFALIKKGNLLTNNKQYPEALKMFNKAIKTYSAANDNPSLLYAYIEKKRMFMLMESYEAASKLGDSIYSLTITNFNKRFADGVSEMETKYKTADKEREILKQRAEIAEKGLLLQKRQYLIYGALGLALLFFILGYVFYNQQKLKNAQLIKENELKVALKEIETQNKLQDQRLRISRDLHDNIGAQLSFIISSIDNLKYKSKSTSEEFQNKLNYISDFTSGTIDQLRDTIWAMNKNKITITDLQSRTLALIEKAKVAKEDIKFVFNKKITSEIEFTAIEGMNLFRVIQEAVNNSLKYSKANLVTITFNKIENQLVFTITDNGIGFERESIKLGNGLYNMQKRIDEINAHININSIPSDGTEIKITYPLTTKEI